MRFKSDCVYYFKQFISSIPYTAKHSRGKTFVDGIENDRSQENVHGSSFF